MALTVMSIILYVGVFGLIFYMVHTFGGLPTGEKKQAPVSLPSTKMNNYKGQPAASHSQISNPTANVTNPPVFKPPSSNIFNPSNNVTNQTAAYVAENEKDKYKKKESENKSIETNPWKKQAKMNNTSNISNNNKKPGGLPPVPKPGKPSGPPPAPGGGGNKPKGPPPVPKK